MVCIVAVVGIVEFFTWNGKILWLFVPYDWGVAQTNPLSRAMGPFVNFDHFGNYLAMVLPLAAGGALFRDDLFSEKGRSRVLRRYRLSSHCALCCLALRVGPG